MSARKSNDVKANLAVLLTHVKVKTTVMYMTPGRQTESRDTGQYSVKQYNKAIKNMNKGKSADIDQIINEYKKHSVPKLMPVHVYLFNTGEIPGDWTVGSNSTHIKATGGCKGYLKQPRNNSY